MAIFDEFCRKKTICMFATDIAARGLDFPAVDWVVQADCPEDADTYIHRVGRTARYDSTGNGLLFLLTSEKQGMLDLLKVKKIPITEIKVNPEKIKISVSKMMQALCFKDPEVKYLGQKAFTSYIRSIYLQKHKQIFNVDLMPLEKFAASLGLPGTPKLKFIEKKNNPNLIFEMNEEQSSECDDKEDDKHKIVTKIDKMFKRRNMGVLSEHYQAMLETDSEKEGEGEKDEFMVVKRANHEVDGEEVIVPVIPVTKREILKAKEKAFKQRGRGERKVFDEEGNAISLYQMETLDAYANRIKGDFSEDDDNNVILKVGQVFRKEEALKMATIDMTDKQIEKERLKERKRQRKLREKEIQREAEEENAARLGSDESESGIDSEDPVYQEVSDAGEYFERNDESEEGVIDIDMDELVTTSNKKRKSMQSQVLEIDATNHKKKKMVDSLRALAPQTLEEIAISLIK